MRSVFALLSAAVTLIATAPAAAYCRATTCSKAKCATDANGCVVEGEQVAWSSGCITVSLQADGAPHAGIDYEAAKASVERAAEAWTSVDCPGGGHPSLQVNVTGPVACSESEYNPDKGNANIVIFRDDSWPYAGQSQDSLGYTRIHFANATGELYDADIELNAVDEALAVGRKPQPNEADLDSIVTHEMGHLLGLNHSLNVAATMVAGYQNGTYELRTLDQDDIEGICAIYPPDRQPTSQSCEPRHGFSEQCGADQPASQDPSSSGDESDVGSNSKGCSASPAPAPTGTAWAVLSLVAVPWLRRRRSSARATRR